MALSYFDRWGNVSENPVRFCGREQVVRARAEFQREVKAGAFDADEKCEVPLPKIPAAGEFVELTQTFELQGAKIEVLALAGAGEFVSQNRRIISAKKELSPVQPRGPGGRPLPTQRFEANLMVRPANPRQRYSSDDEDEPSEIITSKGPYIVLRRSSGLNELRFDILQRDRESLPPFSRSSSMAQLWLSQMGSEGFRNVANHTSGVFRTWPELQNVSLLQYVSLDMKPGETNRTLTFIAQKPQRVDFFVKTEPRK
jgi:hypothetical protein